MRFFLAALLAVTFNVSAYGQQSTEEQLADALGLIQQLELERDLAQLEADEAKLAARRYQIALRQSLLEIEQLKAQLTSSQVDAGTPTVQPAVSQECSRSNVEACDAETLCDRGTYGSYDRWRTTGEDVVFAIEAQSRGLPCGVPSVSLTDRDLIIGEQSAPLTVISYTSWTCADCRAYHESIVKEVIMPAVETGQVKFVPRSVTRNAADFRAELVARCEGIDYSVAADLLYSRQSAYSSNSSELVDSALVEILSPFGMDLRKYAGCLTDADKGSDVHEINVRSYDIDDPKPLMVFVNGRRLQTAPLSALRETLASQIAEAPVGAGANNGLGSESDQ